MPNEVTVEPAALLLTAEAKEHLVVGHNKDDEYIGLLITKARRFAEIYTGKAFCTQTRKQYWDKFPRDRVLRPQYPPLISVTSLAYTDTAGDAQTLTEDTDFEIDKISQPARIRPCYQKVWPPTRAVLNAITLTYTCGFGARTAVPVTLRHAVLLLVGHWYEHREPVITGTTITPIPLSVHSLLDLESVGNYVNPE